MAGLLSERAGACTVFLPSQPCDLGQVTDFRIYSVLQPVLISTGCPLTVVIELGTVVERGSV